MVDIGSKLYTGEGSHYIREFVFAMKNPSAAFKNWVLEWSNYKYNIVDNVTRFQLYIQEPFDKNKPVHNHQRIVYRCFTPLKRRGTIKQYFKYEFEFPYKSSLLILSKENAVFKIKGRTLIPFDD